MAIKTGYLGSYVVSGGQITLSQAVKIAQVGLPYTSTVKPMKLDIAGLGIIATKRISKAMISFYDTLGGKFGTTTTAMDTIPFRTATDQMDESPPFFTGEKELCFPGAYEHEGDIIIQQDLPMPMTVRGVALDVGVETG